MTARLLVFLLTLGAVVPAVAQDVTGAIEGTVTDSTQRVQNWNVSVQRSLFDRYLIEARYVGAKGDHLPRNVEANPAVFGPGATAQNADRRRIYGNCPSDGSACDFSTIAMLRSVARSEYHAPRQASRAASVPASGSTSRTGIRTATITCRR